MSVILVNNLGESFTPTHSGAISTWVWEAAQAARAFGTETEIVTRGSEHPSYVWPGLVEIPPPSEWPSGFFHRSWLRARRKAEGWPSLWHPVMASCIMRLLKDHSQDGRGATVVLHNDPELAVYLSRRLRHLQILHVFHNVHDSRPLVRGRYGTAAITSVAVSHFIAREIERLYGLRHSSIHTVHNGVNLKQFRPSQRGSVESASPPIVNYTGRMMPFKGPDVLLRSLLELTKSNSNFSLQLIGASDYHRHNETDYCRSLDKMISRLMDQGISVRRLGHLPRTAIGDELRKADISVVPSRWSEPFGLVALEAMACGLATLGSNAGGLPEVIGDRTMLFPTEDHIALATLLAQLLENRKLLREKQQAALQRAQNFEWIAMWERITSLMENPHQVQSQGQAYTAPVVT